MAERKYISKKDRMLIYNKFGGHCAYCGIEMEYKDMQVDHVVPLEGWSKQGSDTLDNMFPACRSCNHYKRARTLEGWRRILEKTPQTLERDCYTYRQAVRFGTVTPTPKKIVFYFEKYNREGVSRND